VIITTVTATWRRTTRRRASGLRRPLTKGFDWQGTIYSSLSAIARAITGTVPGIASVVLDAAPLLGPTISAIFGLLHLAFVAGLRSMTIR
jgi:hypothetical protein